MVKLADMRRHHHPQRETVSKKNLLVSVIMAYWPAILILSTATRKRNYVHFQHIRNKKSQRAPDSRLLSEWVLRLRGLHDRPVSNPSGLPRWWPWRIRVHLRILWRKQVLGDKSPSGRQVEKLADRQRLHYSRTCPRGTLRAVLSHARRTKRLGQSNCPTAKCFPWNI